MRAVFGAPARQNIDIGYVIRGKFAGIGAGADGGEPQHRGGKCKFTQHGLQDTHPARMAEITF